MKTLQKTLQTKLSTNVTNQRLLLFKRWSCPSRRIGFCFLIQVTDDMNAIGRSINSALQLSRIGGGLGSPSATFVKLEHQSRATKEPLLGRSCYETSKIALLEPIGTTSRGWWCTGTSSTQTSCLLSTKKENADEKSSVKTLSLGVVVPDKFYELARKNEEMYLFSPYSVEREYGVPFNYIDITEKIHELVANPNIRKTKSRHVI